MTFNITLGWPQLIYLGLLLYGIATQILQHNKPREPLHAGWLFVSVPATIGLLYWGGFFG